MSNNYVTSNPWFIKAEWSISLQDPSQLPSDFNRCGKLSWRFYSTKLLSSPEVLWGQWHHLVVFGWGTALWIDVHQRYLVECLWASNPADPSPHHAKTAWSDLITQWNMLSVPFLHTLSQACMCSLTHTHIHMHYLTSDLFWKIFWRHNQ